MISSILNRGLRAVFEQDETILNCVLTGRLFQ